MNEALLEKARLLHQESEALEERKSFVEQQIEELTVFTRDLATLNDAPSEMLASLGKGVFVKGMMQGGEFFVDVGAGVIVKKSLPEVRDIIQGQLEGLEQIRKTTHVRLEELQGEFEEILKNLKPESK